MKLSYNGWSGRETWSSNNLALHISEREERKTATPRCGYWQKIMGSLWVIIRCETSEYSSTPSPGDFLFNRSLWVFSNRSMIDFILFVLPEISCHGAAYAFSLKEVCGRSQSISWHKEWSKEQCSFNPNAALGLRLIQIWIPERAHKVSLKIQMLHWSAFCETNNSSGVLVIFIRKMERVWLNSWLVIESGNPDDLRCWALTIHVFFTLKNLWEQDETNVLIYAWINTMYLQMLLYTFIIC